MKGEKSWGPRTGKVLPPVIPHHCASEIVTLVERCGGDTGAGPGARAYLGQRNEEEQHHGSA